MIVSPQVMGSPTFRREPGTSGQMETRNADRPTVMILFAY